MNASAQDHTGGDGLVPVMELTVAESAVVPYRAHADDAGLDLISAEEVSLAAGGRALVATGVRLALPAGTVGMVCPRSGLATKHGVTVLNGPGIIDTGYRGEIKVPLHNTDLVSEFRIRPGDRIAQLVIVPFLAPRLEVVQELPGTERSAQGFGSSGGVSATHPESVLTPVPDGREEKE